MSEVDSISRTIGRKSMLNIRMEFPAYAGPIYRPSPMPTETPTKVIPKKIPVSDIDTLEQDITMDFEDNSPYQEGVISEIYQRPDKSYFKSHQNCKV